MDKKHIDIFQKTRVTETTPGSLIADMEILLTKAEQEGIAISEKTKHITMNQLIGINEALTSPLKTAHIRPTQVSLPNIHGLYILLRISGLTKVQRKKKKAFLVTHGPTVETWKGLNNEEKYASLLKYFLFTPHDTIESSMGTRMPTLYKLWDLFEKLSVSPLKIRGDKDLENSCTYNYGTYFMVLLELFGMVTITQAKANRGEKWFPETLTSTPLGEAFIALILDSLNKIQTALIRQDDPNKLFMQMIAPYMPVVKDLLPDAEDPIREFRDGLYTFEVRLQKSSRRIVIPATEDFSTFSETILNAFNFYNDHLYMFKFEDRFGTKIQISYEEDLDSYSSDTAIGDLSMDEGDKIVFIFDFGDWWEFDITLEQIDKPDKSIKEAKITDRKGTPPQQYPYDDEDYDC